MNKINKNGVYLKLYKTLKKVLPYHTDFIGVLCGLKPVSRIEIYSDIKDKPAYFFKLFGLWHILKKSPIQKEVTFLFSSKSKKLIIKMIESIIKKDDYMIGKLLGFPDCCLKKFIKESKTKNNFSFTKSHKELYDYIKNNKINIAYNDFFAFNKKYFKYSLIRYMPCSYKCHLTEQYVKKLLFYIKRFNNLFEKDILHQLKLPILYFSDEQIGNYIDRQRNAIIFDGKMNQNKVKYKKIYLCGNPNKIPEINSFNKGDSLVVDKWNITIYSKNKIIKNIKKDNPLQGYLLNFFN